MFRVASKLAAIMALSVSTLVHAQNQDIPKDISGRWNVPSSTLSQTFSLQEIAVAPDSTFTAKLTWWTIESRCAVLAAPISGRVTTTGLTFDSKTKCDVVFTVELNRDEKGWNGKGATRSGPLVSLEIKVN